MFWEDFSEMLWEQKLILYKGYFQQYLHLIEYLTMATSWFWVSYNWLCQHRLPSLQKLEVLSCAILSADNVSDAWICFQISASMKSVSLVANRWCLCVSEWHPFTSLSKVLRFTFWSVFNNYLNSILYIYSVCFFSSYFVVIVLPFCYAN